MTYQEYWYGDVWAIIDARKADKLRMERKNQELWLQGRYFYDAMWAISPLLHAFAKNGTKPTPYCEEPYPIGGEKPKEKSEQEAENERLQAMLYMENMVHVGKSWSQ